MQRKTHIYFHCQFNAEIPVQVCNFICLDLFFWIRRKDKAGRSTCGSSCLSLLHLCAGVLYKVFLGQAFPSCTKAFKEAFLLSPDCMRKEYAIILQMNVSNHLENFELTHANNFFPPMLTSFNSIPASQNYENNGRPKGEVAAWNKKCRLRNTGTIFTFLNSHIDTCTN